MYHQLYMIGSCILEHRSHYYFDIVMSMDIPTSSIYMSHMIFILYIDENHINTKTKSDHAPAQKHHLSTANPMIFVGHMMSSHPQTSRDNLLTKKFPHSALHGLHHPRTPMYDPYFTPLDPHTLKMAQKYAKGLKNP